MLSGLVTQNADTVLSDGMRTSLVRWPAGPEFVPPEPTFVGTHRFPSGWHLARIGRLRTNWLPVSTASSRKKQWPTVLKVTLFSTRTLSVPWTVTQRL